MGGKIAISGILKNICTPQQLTNLQFFDKLSNRCAFEVVRITKLIDVKKRKVQAVHNAVLLYEKVWSMVVNCLTF